MKCPKHANRFTMHNQRKICSWQSWIMCKTLHKCDFHPFSQRKNQNRFPNFEMNGASTQVTRIDFRILTYRLDDSLKVHEHPLFFQYPHYISAQLWSLRYHMFCYFDTMFLLAGKTLLLVFISRQHPLTPLSSTQCYRQITSWQIAKRLCVFSIWCNLTVIDEKKMVRMYQSNDVTA